MNVSAWRNERGGATRFGFMRGFAFARYYGSRLLLNTALTLNRVCSTLNRGNGDHEASRRSHRFLFSRLDRSSLASIHLSVFRSNFYSPRGISSGRTDRIGTIYNWNTFSRRVFDRLRPPPRRFRSKTFYLFSQTVRSHPMDEYVSESNGEEDSHRVNPVADSSLCSSRLRGD